MRCPFCSHDETQVVETRESDEGDVVRRRRRCQGCDKRFTTYERAEIALPSVVKKDGTRAEFDVGKIRASMTLAVGHRRWKRLTPLRGTVYRKVSASARSMPVIRSVRARAASRIGSMAA